MFIDASAIVAILNEEPEADALVNCIETAGELIMFSPLVRFEATVSLAKARTRGGRLNADILDKATAAVDLFLEEIEAVEVAVTPEIGRLAVAASGRYGKVVGHSAALNFGDCFAYACARAQEQTLLFVGGDFSQTDAVKALT